MPTNHKGTEEERLILNAYICLLRCSDSLSKRTHAHLLPAKLTPMQFGVMEALLHLGPLNQRQLAVKHLRSDGNMTLVIGNLEKRGFVRRKRDLNDRRNSRVELTEKGSKLAGKLFRDHLKGLRDQFACLNHDEQEHLYRLCRKLGKQEEGKD